MLVLFIAHHLLKRNWHKRLSKGRYTPARTAMLCIDILLLLAMLALMYSGIILSRHAFVFLPIGEKRCFEENKAVWRALEDACRSGKLKAIGVSNFLIDDLESLLFSCSIKPMINQVPYRQYPMELIKFSQMKSIAMEAYSPIVHGKALKNSSIVSMAKKYGVSVP